VNRLAGVRTLFSLYARVIGVVYGAAQDMKSIVAYAIFDISTAASSVVTTLGAPAGRVNQLDALRRARGACRRMRSLSVRTYAPTPARAGGSWASRDSKRPACPVHNPFKKIAYRPGTPLGSAARALSAKTGMRPVPSCPSSGNGPRVSPFSSVNESCEVPVAVGSLVVRGVVGVPSLEPVPKRWVRVG
jgi:hypothetical protein